MEYLFEQVKDQIYVLAAWDESWNKCYNNI